MTNPQRFYVVPYAQNTDYQNVVLEPGEGLMAPDGRAVLGDGVTVGGIPHATQVEVNAKPDRYPADPYSSISAGYQDAVDGWYRNFFDLTNTRIRPTSGLGPTFAGTPNDTLAQPSVWQMCQGANVIFERWKETTSSTYASHLAGEWTYLKAVFTPAQLLSPVYGTNLTSGLSDDSAHFARFLTQVHEATGDATALSYAIEYIAATLQMYRDPLQTGTDLIDGAASTPGYAGQTAIPIKWNRWGILYPSPTDEGGIRGYGYFSSGYEPMLAYAALYVSQQVATPAAVAAAYLAYAQSVFNWTSGSNLSPVSDDQSQPVAGLVGGSFNLDPNVQGPDVNFTASISGTVLTVTAVSSGTFQVGMWFRGGHDSAGQNDITQGTRIASFGTGTGGTGTYNLTIPSGGNTTVASRTMTCSMARTGNGDGSQTYHATRNGAMGRPQRGSTAWYDGGTYAFIALASRLYEITGTDSYRDAALASALGASNPRGFGRSPGGVPCLMNCQDPWTSGTWLPTAVRHLIALTAPEELPVFKAAVLNSARIILASSSEGFLTPDWSGEDYNPSSGQYTWEQESMNGYSGSGGGGQARREQLMAASTSLSVVSAAVKLAPYEAQYGSGLESAMPIEASPALFTAFLQAISRHPAILRLGRTVRIQNNTAQGLIQFFLNEQELHRLSATDTDFYTDVHTTGKMTFGGDGNFWVGKDNAYPNLRFSSACSAYYDYVNTRFKVAINGSDVMDVRAGDMYVYGGIHPGYNVDPQTDNYMSCGTSPHRFSQVYAGASTIATSDSREKTWRGALTADELAAAKAIAATIGIYQWNSSIAAKGADHARLHSGVIAQTVVSAMEAHGLDPMRYGFVCYDAWDAQAGQDAVEAEFDDKGEMVTPPQAAIPATPAGNRYGIRYEELAMFIAAAQEQRLAALEAK